MFSAWVHISGMRWRRHCAVAILLSTNGRHDLFSKSTVAAAKRNGLMAQVA